MYVTESSGGINLKQTLEKSINSIKNEIEFLKNKLLDEGFINNADPEEISKITNRISSLEADLLIYLQN